MFLKSELDWCIVHDPVNGLKRKRVEVILTYINLKNMMFVDSVTTFKTNQLKMYLKIEHE